MTIPNTNHHNHHHHQRFFHQQPEPRIVRGFCLSLMEIRQPQYILLTIVVLFLLLLDLRITKMYEPFGTLQDTFQMVASDSLEWLMGNKEEDLEGIVLHDFDDQDDHY